MNRCVTFLAVILLFLFSLTGLCQDAVRYDLDVSLNLSTYALQGFGTITLNQLPASGKLELSKYVDEQLLVHLNKAYADGNELTTSSADSSYFIDLTGITAPLTIELDWRIPNIPEHEGIVMLTDGLVGDKRVAWYPRILNYSQSDIHLSLMIQGEADLASNSTTSKCENIGGMMECSLSGTDSLELILSPIFVSAETLVGDSQIRVFMREGADTWRYRILGYASEIQDFYAAAIPGYSPERIDIVFAGKEHPQGNIVPGIVVIEDVIDRYVADLGAVFTGNFIRWQLATKMAGAWFSREIKTPDTAIPWLPDGLAHHFAYEYAQAVLLGGPAFDNIKQQYLNASTGERSLSLNQTRAEAGEMLKVLSESKGFWIIGMLRQQMGKRAFENWLDSLQNYSGLVDNNTIERLTTEKSDADISRFFQTWVYNDTRLDLGVLEADIRSNGLYLEVENTADQPIPTTALLSLESGQDIRKDIVIQPGKSEVTFETDSAVRRVRLDPDRIYPDVKRGNNMRSFGSTAAIDQLYAIDNLFTIGDLELVSDPVPAGRQRVADFQISITNRQSTEAYLGLHLTTAFPGGRNRGISKLLIQLAPEETQTLHDLMFIPALGYGPMTIKAEFFIVSSQEAFEKLGLRSKPNLTSWYTYGIEKK